MKNILVQIESLLYPRITIEQMVVIALKKEAKIVMETDHTIRTEQFHRHMALGNISALEEWNKLQKTNGRA